MPRRSRASSGTSKDSRKPLLIPDLQYLAAGQRGRLSGRLKYLQYRDGSVRMALRRAGRRWEAMERVPDTIPGQTRHPDSGERWLDRGLGNNWRQIAQRLAELEGEQICARFWVLSPDPELLGLLDEAERYRLLAETSERFIETLYERQGWGRPEYSYVLHKRLTHDTDPEGQPQAVREHLHVHLVTPGTHHSGIADGNTQPRFVSAELAHELGNEVFEALFLPRLERQLARRADPQQHWEHAQQVQEIAPRFRFSRRVADREGKLTPPGLNPEPPPPERPGPELGGPDLDLDL